MFSPGVPEPTADLTCFTGGGGIGRISRYAVDVFLSGARGKLPIALRHSISQSGDGGRISSFPNQGGHRPRFTASQMTCRAPPRLPFARTATSSVTKPVSRKRLLNFASGADDQTARI